MSSPELEMIFENFIGYCLKTNKSEYNKLNLLLFTGSKLEAPWAVDVYLTLGGEYSRWSRSSA